MGTVPSTADRIKMAALMMFTESGYEGASLSQIAKEVGIKTPSLYAHFESKEQIFLQLIEDVISEERGQYRELLQEMKNEKIEQQVYRLFDFFTNLSHMSTGQAFLKRTILVPPRHLRDQLREDFLEYEVELAEGIAQVWRQGVSTGVFGEQDEERMIATFFVFVDGLLVENNLYEEKLFNKRKQLNWLSLWQIWTMTARED